VLVNAIESLTRYGQLSPAPGWLRWLVLVVVLVGGGALAARLHHFWGLVLSGSIVIVALVPLSLHLLHYGRWLDFALPLCGVLLHNLAGQAESAATPRRGGHQGHGRGGRA
jgi:CHASE2 domain-containing sensor protein